MKVVVKYSFVQSFILDASNGKVSSALSSRDFPRGYLVNIVLLTVPLPPLQISRQRGGCAKHGELRHHMRDSLPRSTCMEQAARLRDSNSCRCMTSALIFHVLASNVLHAVSVRRNSLIVVQSVRCNAAASGASCESPCVCLPTSALKDLVSDCTIHSNLEVDRNRSLASGPEHAMMTTVFQSSTPPPLATAPCPCLYRSWSRCEIAVFLFMCNLVPLTRVGVIKGEVSCLIWALLNAIQLCFEDQA